MQIQRTARGRSISTITCKIPGKPLKRCGAYAIVTALNQPQLVPAASHRSIIAFWLVLGLAPQAFAQDLCLVPTEPPSSDLAPPPASDCEDGTATTNARDQRERIDVVSAAEAVFSGEVEIKLPAAARSRRRAPARSSRRQRRRARPRRTSSAPTSWSLAKTRTTTRSARRSASRAPASICRNGRRAAPRSRSRSPATAACRSLNVLFTTCPPENLAWELSARDTELDVNGGVGTARGVKLDFKGVPILYAPYFTFPINDAAQERLSHARHQQARPHGLRSDRALLPEPRAELRPDARAALHERARHAGAQRLPLSLAEQPRRFRLRVLARRRRDEHDAPLRQSCSTSRCSACATSWRCWPESKKSPTTPISRTSAAALSVTSQTHLNRFLDLTFFAPNWSLLTRLQNYQTIDPVLTDAERPYERVPQMLFGGRWLGRLLMFDSEHGARELRSQRRHDGLAARLDAGGEPALRARRHVPDAGRRAPPNELLDRQSRAGRGRHF